MGLNDGTSIKAGEDFLSHYGIKGMHWGMRNDKDARVKSSVNTGKSFMEKHKPLLVLTANIAFSALAAAAVVATIFKPEIQNFRYDWAKPWVSGPAHGLVGTAGRLSNVR